ncbi:hypothetical protein UG55_100215 [Frankia sp. EI5c]|uniref:hypothetical protein n=1 Tax=Frankia sp. EI5c TaxID=683316 RepID=UPI0007C3979C|nr:hypothetical protein [Frankia sp. EI5c]OAA29384.1 hypothetical protein UG55_100215 [Frankia sp. EI5c]
MRRTTPPAAGRDRAARATVAGEAMSAEPGHTHRPDRAAREERDPWGSWPRTGGRLVRVLGRLGAGRLAQQRSRIEVGNDWRRCGSGDGGCGVLLPLSQPTCPRCGRTSRADLAPLDRRLPLEDDEPGAGLVVVLPGAAHPGGHRPAG